MKQFALIGAVLLMCIAATAQQQKWSVSIEQQKVFIENLSQFNERYGVGHTDVLFGTDDGPGMIYFTRNGLIFTFEHHQPKTEHDFEPEKSGKDKEEGDKEASAKKDIVQMQWENANPAVQVIPSKVANGYFNYQIADKPVQHARAYRKLLYKNIYPNIDIEYVFDERGGIKYTIYLHPGADITKLKMKYSGVKGIIPDADGNLHFPTLFGDIIDHAPVSYYSESSGGTIATSFTKTAKTITFSTAPYDHSKTLVIDPWTTTPSMPSSNSVFYIKSDGAGNAYIYGGDSPFRLQKYDTGGNLQWTYNTPWNTGSHWFGALATDRLGNSYITDGDGATLAKIDTGGGFVWSHSSSQAPANALEYWAMDFNCDQTQLYVGGTRDIPFSFDFHGDVFKMNMTDGSISSFVSVVHPSFGVGSIGFNEVRSMCFSPNGNLYYLTLDTVGSVTQGLNINYGRGSGYSFPYYLPYSNTGGGQGQNNIRATLQYLYTTDGQMLHKRDINTGVVVDSVAIPGGSADNNSGVAIDSCGNVYVGAQQKVVKFDANLNFVTSATTPEAVYDISIGANGDVLACGHNFAVALAMSACPQIAPICNTTLSASTVPTNLNCSGQCNGSATANVTNGTAPYTYSWSNGQTTQTATGLCANTYTVTISDASGNSVTASAVISGGTGFTANASATNTSCGNANGSVTVNTNPNSGSFTYLWNNGATTASLNNLAAGTYMVTVTGPGGCSATASGVVNPSSGTLNITTDKTLMCSGDSAHICAPSGYSAYIWNTGATTNCIYAGLAGNYYVTVTDAGNCTVSSNHISIAVRPVPSVSISVNGDTLTSYNATSYQWYLNGSPISGATSPIYIAMQSGNYQVLVTDTSGCTALSNAVNLTVNDILDLSNQGVNIFPNPTTESWFLEVTNDLVGSSVEIFDNRGRVVYKSTIQNANTELKIDAAQGVYLMKIYGKHKAIEQKLIKL